jgi:hypothetical protein
MSQADISTQSEQDDCKNCESLETERAALVNEMDGIHKTALKMHEKVELIVN